MGKPYSVDLRERVVSAVERDRLSRHRAAARFGVGVSTAINWVRRFRETGSVAPGRMGGHRPKKIRGEHRAWLVHRAREKEFTLRGLVAELAGRGLEVDYRTMWNFVHAEKLSFKKKPGRQRTGSSRRGAAAGPVDQASGPDRSFPPGLPRRDLDQDHHGADPGMGATGPQAPGQGSTPPLEDDDLPRRPAP